MKSIKQNKHEQRRHERMKTEQIKEIANTHNIGNPNVFIKFIQLRFPDEACPSYVGEWATRFKTGNPVAYMDNESKKAYIKACEEC